MEYLHKLPFIMGTAMAIIVGLLANLSGASQQDTYFRMAIALVVFFIIGLIARSSLTKIIEDLNRKREEDERQRQLELEEMEKQEEEKQKTEAGNKNLGANVDLKVEDDDEDFSPLTVSQYIDSDTIGKT